MQRFELEYEREWEEEGELAGSPPALRRLADQSARAALSALSAEFEEELEAEYEVGFEEEWEEESEGMINPIRRVYPELLMEHFAHIASQTESEAEAEAFIGVLVPMAARMLPQVAPAIMRAAPRLIRGVTRVTRLLRSSHQTRQLVRTLPSIVRQTARTMARQQAAGKPVTPRGAVRTLARQTHGVLGSPRQSLAAMRRSQVLDRRYHRALARPVRPSSGERRAEGGIVIGDTRPLRRRRAQPTVDGAMSGLADGASVPMETSLGAGLGAAPGSDGAAGVCPVCGGPR